MVNLAALLIGSCVCTGEQESGANANRRMSRHRRKFKGGGSFASSAESWRNSYFFTSFERFHFLHQNGDGEVACVDTHNRCELDDFENFFHGGACL